MKKIFTLMMILAFGFHVYGEGVNGVVYVRPGGDGDGSSWRKPMGDIAAALSEAVKVNDKRKDVWIAAGEYTLAGTLNIPDSVNVYGGFKGRETSLDKRQIKLNGKSWDFINETIILGTNCTDHTIKMAGYNIPTAIDGLTIKGGKRAVHVRTNSIVRNCKIIENETTGNGAAIDSYYGGQVLNCYIAHNKGNNGGALYTNTRPGHQFYVEGCLIEYNEGNAGGGIRIQGSGKSIVKSCFILGNTSTDNGSAVSNNSESSDEYVSEFINCVFANNTSIGKASIYTLSGHFWNCTIVNNDGNNAVWVASTKSSTSFKNCIVWGNVNSFDDKNVGIGVSSAHKNGLFINNAAYSIGNPSEDSEGNMFFADNSTNGDIANVEDGFLKSGPKFVKPTTFAGTPADDTQKADLMEADWSLVEGSPLLNVGVTIADVTIDIIGTKRPQGSGYDIGAYELKSESSISDDSMETTPAIRLIGNRIVVEAQGEVEIYSITGKLVRRARSTDTILMNVPGVYVVKSGTKSTKIIVR